MCPIPPKGSIPPAIRLSISIGGGLGTNSRSTIYSEPYASYRANTIPRGQKVGYTFEVRKCIRAGMQAKLARLEDDIELCKSYSLDAYKLISEANSLREKLRYFW